VLIATFKSDAWQVAYTARMRAFPGGDLVPLTTVSDSGPSIAIAVPESLLDQELLEGLLGRMLVDEWNYARPHFNSIGDALAQLFAHCLPEWLNYAGGGLFAFGWSNANAVEGGIYVGLYSDYVEHKPNNADRSGYEYWLVFVVDGVAASEGAFCEADPVNTLHAMYAHWLKTWGSQSVNT
jgi:hypothetical protein